MSYRVPTFTHRAPLPNLSHPAPLTRCGRRRKVCCPAAAAGTTALPQQPRVAGAARQFHSHNAAEERWSTRRQHRWQCQPLTGPLTPKPWHFADVLHPTCTEQLAKGRRAPSPTGTKHLSILLLLCLTRPKLK